MKNHFETKKIAISVFLSFCLLLSYVLMILPVTASETTVERQSMLAKLSLDEESNLFSFVDKNDLMKAGHISRLKDNEEMNTYSFRNTDNTITTYYLGENAKYLDNTGNVVEKNTSLKTIIGGYTMADNNVDVVFPLIITRGIRYSGNGMSFNMTPVSDVKAIARLSNNNSVIYKDVFGEYTSLEYTPTLSGFKEDIILEQYFGKTEFHFTLATDNLTVYKENNSYYLVPSTESGEEQSKIEIPPIVAYDSTGRFDVGTLDFQLIEEGTYSVTVSVNEQFLTDDDTVYPVRIDPSFSDNDQEGFILDAPVFSNRPDLNCGNFIYLTAGYTDDTYKIGRVLVKTPGFFNNMSLGTCTSDMITSVKYCCVDASGHGPQYIHIYRNVSSWDESTVTWRNKPSYYNVVDWGGTMNTAGSITKFDITSLVKSWKENVYDWNAGFVMVNSDEINQSKKKAPFSSEYAADTSLRPYIEFTYTSSRPEYKDVYYLNNLETGKYAYRNGTTLSGKSGLLSNIGNNIRWKLEGNADELYIKCHNDFSRYLAVVNGSLSLLTITGGTVPDSCKWQLQSTAVGIGKLFVNIQGGASRYLYSTESGVLNVTSYLGTASTSTYRSRCWRFIAQSKYGDNESYQYRELEYTVQALPLLISETLEPTIVSAESNMIWNRPSDFKYTISKGAAYISIVDGYKFKGLSRGNATITVTHKPTGITTNFYVCVCTQTLTIRSFYDNGFLTRNNFSQYEAISVIRKYTSFASGVYAYHLGVKFIIDAPALYATTADRCATGHSNIHALNADCQCAGTTIGSNNDTDTTHKNNRVMITDFISTHASTDTIKYYLWTGHTTREWDGSVRKPMNNGAFTRNAATAFLLNPTINDEDEMKYTVTHEAGHFFDIPDSYCAGDFCTSSTCCKHGNSGYDEKCIMANRMDEYGDIKDWLCPRCIEDANTYLNRLN